MATLMTVIAMMIVPVVPVVEETSIAVKAEAREMAFEKVVEWRAGQRRIAKEREERRIASYGPWAVLASEVGWSEAELPTLMRIIKAESGGSPRAYNESSGCSGLLQLHPCWYNGYWHFDPFDPRLNLLYGLKVKRMYGWSQWSTWGG